MYYKYNSLNPLPLSYTLQFHLCSPQSAKSYRSSQHTVQIESSEDTSDTCVDDHQANDRCGHTFKNKGNDDSKTGSNLAKRHVQEKKQIGRRKYDFI